MNSSVSKKVSKKTLKLILYHYINLLLASKPENVKLEQIKIKIKNDIDILSTAFDSKIGNKLIASSTLKILNDILEFLNSNHDMISSPCLSLKKYIGILFNLNTLKNLINLRTDFKEQDINNSIEKCKQVLDEYKENKNSPLIFSK